MGWGTPWRIHVGVHGGSPLNFPYLVSAQKDLSVGFLFLFSTPNIKAVMPVFAPKSAVLDHYFQKNSGWNKCTQNAGKCTIPHEGPSALKGPAVLLAPPPLLDPPLKSYSSTTHDSIPWSQSLKSWSDLSYTTTEIYRILQGRGTSIVPVA